MSPKIGYRHSESAKIAMRGHRKLSCSRGHLYTVAGRYAQGQCKVCAKNHCRESSWKRTGVIVGQRQFNRSDYDKALLNQNSRCAICNRHEKDIKRTLYVDHCHKTNFSRGLLCLRCNAALGFYENNIDAIRIYLKEK